MDEASHELWHPLSSGRGGEPRVARKGLVTAVAHKRTEQPASRVSFETMYVGMQLESPNGSSKCQASFSARSKASAFTLDSGVFGASVRDHSRVLRLIELRRAFEADTECLDGP